MPPKRSAMYARAQKMSVDDIAKMLEYQDALTEALKRFKKDKGAGVDFAKMSTMISRFNPKEYMGTGEWWDKVRESALDVYLNQVVTPMVEPVATTETPVIGQERIVDGQSMSRRLISKLLRNDSGEPRLFTPRGITFMDALNLSMQKARTESRSKPGFQVTSSENGHHPGGRVWLLWDPTLYQVDVLNITEQCIHSKVYDKMKKDYFWFTLMYGFNKLLERESLWESIKVYGLTVDGPWLVCGDFNSITSVDERIGGVDVTWAEIAPMRDMMNVCNLHVLKVTGSFYTWNNKHESDTKVYSRLDRVIVYDEWLIFYPVSMAQFLPEGLFDHCPCVITLNETHMRKKPAFKYFNMWSMAANFSDVVKDGWNIDVQGTPMYRIVKKLKGLKHQLKKLDKEQFSDIENLTHVTELSLKFFQDQLTRDPMNPDLCKAARECAQDLVNLTKARNSFVAQRAKENWVKNGDENTAFFHASIKRRWAHNRVYQIKDNEGTLCTTPQGIKTAFEEYYIGLLGSSRKVTSVHKGVIRSGKCLTSQHKEILTRYVTDDEIRTTMFSIPGTKAPGPDGYSSQFFKDSWPIVGKEICDAVRNMISSGKVLKEANNTILTLVPKVDVLENVTQFRSIACCNTIYKCMAKVLCSRLSGILPDIIHPSQSAFVAGRDIVGNILICQDLIKMYNMKTCSPRILMKIDLQKAYDSIEWNFLQEMLLHLQFPTSSINLIMQCVSSPSYSLSLNGEVSGFFKGRRGLRQGDPLSSLLFAICLDYLSRLLGRDLTSISLKLRAFGTFSLASGLHMNNRKSNFYCNGVGDTIVQAIEIATGMRIASIPFKYLGIKIMPKRLGVLDCQCLVDKVTERIQRLGARKISYAGRVVLISSVLSSLHSYWAMIFMLPKMVLKKIESVCRAFLWYGNENKERPYLVAWNQIYQPKRKGGLGLKNLYQWNIALISKYVWWVEKKADHLWVRWVHDIYIKDRVWKDYEPSICSRWAWKRVIEVKNRFKHLIFNETWRGTDKEYSVHMGYSWLAEEVADVPWNRCRLDHVLPLPAVVIKQVKILFILQLKSSCIGSSNRSVQLWITQLE
ncbi:uncharacterized protein LOC141613514 [Silene latifolia]|uniref:uncharacterized protein LOC141613514 n=1 Tax=Silene latifolia TaxID=37657 RepID=UPI003D76F273